MCLIPLYGIEKQGKSSCTCHEVETRHTREGVSSQRELAAHVLMRQATGLKRKDGIIMREVVQKVYKFNELEKKVQEKVLERERYAWVDEMGWEEWVYEDFEGTMYADHLFQVDEDSVSFSLYSQDAGAGFTGEFETAQAAINAALAFDLKGDINKASILVEIRENGEVRVSHNPWSNTSPRNWNTYIELLIDGVSMEEDEKYAPFVKALEEWKDEECSRLYTVLEKEYDYLTSDEYIIEQLTDENENYEFYADGTDF